MLQHRQTRSQDGLGESGTQLRYAREGTVTGEMRFGAERENMDPRRCGKRSPIPQGPLCPLGFWGHGSTSCLDLLEARLFLDLSISHVGADDVPGTPFSCDIFDLDLPGLESPGMKSHHASRLGILNLYQIDQGPRLGEQVSIGGRIR